MIENIPQAFITELYLASSDEEPDKSGEETLGFYIHQDILDELLKEKKFEAFTIEKLYQSNKVSVDNENAQLFKNCLANLIEKEKEAFIESYLEKANQKFKEIINNETLYRNSEKWVEQITPSLAFLVDIQFDLEGKLKAYKLNLRYSGTQKRHITPMAIIERIFKNTLIEGTGLPEIFKRLKSKIEFFKPYTDGKSNSFIQAVFDYYDNEKQQSISGLNQLVKIIAQFYHELPYLSLNDSCIKIPYKLQDRYLLPRLVIRNSKRVHGSEGSFIKALLKFLDEWESKIELKNLTTLNPREISRIAYAIFALFDFLPLPKDAKQKKTVKADSNKNRFKGEPIERLHNVAAKHILFVFEAYPNIGYFHDTIIKCFLNYVSMGIKLEDLYQIFECTDPSDLVQRLDTEDESYEIDAEYIEQNLIFSGFASQYKVEEKTFLEIVTVKVIQIITQIDEFYIENLATSFDEHEEANTVKQNLEAILRNALPDKGNLQSIIEQAQAYDINLNVFLDVPKFEKMYMKYVEDIRQNPSQHITQRLRKNGSPSEEKIRALAISCCIDECIIDKDYSPQMQKQLSQFKNDLRRRTRSVLDVYDATIHPRDNPNNNNRVLTQFRVFESNDSVNLSNFSSASEPASPIGKQTSSAALTPSGLAFDYSNSFDEVFDLSFAMRNSFLTASLASQPPENRIRSSSSGSESSQLQETSSENPNDASYVPPSTTSEEEQSYEELEGRKERLEPSLYKKKF